MISRAGGVNVQVMAFVQEIIRTPCFVAGNSLGGYLGANLAANHPEWVLGLALFNATPFWAFRKRNGTPGMNTDPSPSTILPAKTGGPETVVMEAAKEASKVEGGLALAQEELQPSADRRGSRLSPGTDGFMEWDGTLPAPPSLFRFGAWYFDRMRDPRTVRSMLAGVYNNAGEYGQGKVISIVCRILWTKPSKAKRR